MVSMAPLSLRVYRMRMAPNTMISTLTALPNPLRVEAATRPAGIFQRVAPIRAQTSHARGMARVAGHLKPTIKINTRAMGINAINADKLRDKPLLLFIFTFARRK
jgi:hypothetical protein